MIGLGNQVTLSTYAGFDHVVMLNGAALHDDTLDWCPKEFDDSRQHFLFFSGPGNVHKGLDLLLEAFAALPQHLWISTSLDHNFAYLYTRRVDETDRISTCWAGFSRALGLFYQVMRRCGFAILPSCSEGQSQSVVECMNQGLVPVVSRDCGLSVDGFGVYIDPCSMDSIAGLVSELSAWDAVTPRAAASQGCAPCCSERVLPGGLPAAPGTGHPGVPMSGSPALTTGLDHHALI